MEKCGAHGIRNAAPPFDGSIVSSPAPFDKRDGQREKRPARQRSGRHLTDIGGCFHGRETARWKTEAENAAFSGKNREKGAGMLAIFIMAVYNEIYTENECDRRTAQ